RDALRTLAAAGHGPHRIGSQAAFLPNQTGEELDRQLVLRRHRLDQWAKRLRYRAIPLRHARCTAARRQKRMLGGVIVHVAPIGHAFVKVVSFGLRRSFCETCGRITGHLRRIRFGGFLATSAVTADALPFMHPTAMQTNPTSALSNFTWANMVTPRP